MKPKYQHDRDCCKFIGHYKDIDFYICLKANSILARYSNEPSEYYSSPINLLLEDKEVCDTTVQPHKMLKFSDIDDLHFGISLIANTARLFLKKKK
jgi:hypothetical protein